MADKIKVVNGHIIKAMTRNEINEELIKAGDWSIDYYVPGRVFYPYFITINRKRHRFNSLAEVEAVCRKYNKDFLKNLDYLEVRDVLRAMV